MTREQSLSVLKLMQSLPLVSLCINGLGAGLGCSEGLSPWVGESCCPETDISPHEYLHTRYFFSWILMKLLFA